MNLKIIFPLGDNSKNSQDLKNGLFLKLMFQDYNEDQFQLRLYFSLFNLKNL